MLYAVVPYRSKDLNCDVYNDNVLVYDTETYTAKFLDIKSVLSSTRQIHGFSITRKCYLGWYTFNYTGLSKIYVSDENLYLDGENVCHMTGVVYAVLYKDLYVVRLVDNDANWTSFAYYQGKILVHWDSEYTDISESIVTYESTEINAEDFVRKIDSELSGV